MVVKCLTETGHIAVTKDTEASAKQALLASIYNDKLIRHPADDGLRQRQLNGVICIGHVVTLPVTAIHRYRHRYSCHCGCRILSATSIVATRRLWLTLSSTRGYNKCNRLQNPQCSDEIATVSMRPAPCR